MADKSNIGWTNATWNPVRGCTRVSEGCRNCYAEVLAARHSYEGGWGYEVAHYLNGEARWTGVIEVPNHAMKLPLKWKAPRMVFVNSMSDLFHEKVPYNVVDSVFAVMDRCPQHTFQILTKRPERMRDYCRRINGAPLENVWLGVSAENQETFDERIPFLMDTPAAVRWVSLEPLLGPIDPNHYLPIPGISERLLGQLDWGVVGGESGSGYRPMDIEAARYIIRQFTDAGVPIFLKQDNGPRPGMQGRFWAEEWALKQYPRREPQSRPE